MLNKVLENKNSVAIGGHIRPDGDCVGSCMGLALYLRDNYPEISVDVYLEKIPEKFLFLSDTDSIKNEIEDKVYDLFICLDCGDVDRLGFSLPLYQSAKHTFCVDHHVSNNSFAANNVIFIVIFPPCSVFLFDPILSNKCKNINREISIKSHVL